MKENKQLNKFIGRTVSAKDWVKDLVPEPTVPFSVWAFDIKYTPIAGQSLNAMMQTVIDVTTRCNIGRRF